MCQNRVRKMISERRPPRIQTAEFVLPSPPTSPLHRPLSPMSPPHIDNSITQPRTSVLDRTTTTISTTTPSTSQRLLQQFINTRAERQRNREQSAGTRRRRLDQITSVVNSYRTPSTRPNVSLPRTQPRTTIIPPIRNPRITTTHASATNGSRSNSVRPFTNIPIPEDLAQPPQFPQPPRRPALSIPGNDNNLTNIQRRLREIENEFRNPLMQEIYRNNRVYLSNGDRVVPTHNGRVHLESDPNAPTILRAPPNEPRDNCIVCMEDVPRCFMIKLPCEYSFAEHVLKIKYFLL